MKKLVPIFMLGSALYLGIPSEQASAAANDKLAWGNINLAHYVASTDAAYWAEATPFKEFLEKLTNYAKTEYNEGSDMDTLMNVVNALYDRPHYDAPDLTAYTDTTWLLGIGVKGTYGEYAKTGEDGRLHQDSNTFGANFGVSKNRAANLKEDLDIFILAMIFSKLTELGNAPMHPLQQYLNHDSVNAIPYFENNLATHRAYMYGLQAMASYLQEQMEKEGAENTSFPKTDYIAPYLGFKTMANDRATLERTYDANLEKVVKIFNSYQIQDTHIYDKEKVKAFLRKPEVRNRFIELFIPVYNNINDLKHLIERQKPAALVLKEEQEAEVAAKEAMKNVNSDIEERNIIVDPAKLNSIDPNTLFQLDTEGPSILYINQGGADLHKGAMISAGNPGALIKYYQIDPQAILSKGSSIDSMSKSFVRSNLKYSVLRVADSSMIAEIEKNFLKNPQLRLVSFGDPATNGIWMFAPQGTYQNNPETVFKPIVQPTQYHISRFTKTYPHINPDETKTIVNGIARYLEALKGGEIIEDKGPVERTLQLKQLTGLEPYAQALQNGEKTALSTLGAIHKNQVKGATGFSSALVSPRGTDYIQVFDSYQDYLTYNKNTTNYLTQKGEDSVTLLKLTGLSLDGRQALKDMVTEGYLQPIGQHLFYIKVKGGNPELTQITPGQLSADENNDLIAFHDQMLKDLNLVQKKK